MLLNIKVRKIPLVIGKIGKRGNILHYELVAKQREENLQNKVPGSFFIGYSVNLSYGTTKTTNCVLVKNVIQNHSSGHQTVENTETLRSGILLLEDKNSKSRLSVTQKFDFTRPTKACIKCLVRVWCTLMYTFNVQPP